MIIKQLNISFKGIHFNAISDLGFDKRLNFVGNSFCKTAREDAFTSAEVKKLVGNNRDKEIIICGLMAEKSIVETAQGALRNGLNVVLIPEAIEGRNEESQNRVIDRLRRKGFKISHISEILN